MTPRHRRNQEGGDRIPEFTPEEVEALTQRADDLLAQLHQVLGEMSDHLQSVADEGGTK